MYVMPHIHTVVCVCVWMHLFCERAASNYAEPTFPLVIKTMCIWLPYVHMYMYVCKCVYVHMFAGIFWVFFSSSYKRAVLWFKVRKTASRFLIFQHAPTHSQSHSHSHSLSIAIPLRPLYLTLPLLLSLSLSVSRSKCCKARIIQTFWARAPPPAIQLVRPTHPHPTPPLLQFCVAATGRQ